jgi:hypothetical protein
MAELAEDSQRINTDFKPMADADIVLSVLMKFSNFNFI